MDNANLRDDRNRDRAAAALRSELPKVVYELHLLRHHILPFLLSPRRLTFPGGVPTVKRSASETDRRLGDRQRCMDLLRLGRRRRMTGETPAPRRSTSSGASFTVSRGPALVGATTCCGRLRGGPTRSATIGRRSAGTSTCWGAVCRRRGSCVRSWPGIAGRRRRPGPRRTATVLPGGFPKAAGDAGRLQPPGPLVHAVAARAGLHRPRLRRAGDGLRPPEKQPERGRRRCAEVRRLPGQRVELRPRVHLEGVGTLFLHGLWAGPVNDGNLRLMECIYARIPL